MADLLLELFSEEIPARMQAEAEHDLSTMLTDKLFEAGLKVNVRGFSTPQRLAVYIPNLPVSLPDTTTELKGPKVDAPQAAIDGFLKKNNLTLAACENRGGVYFANIHTKGRPTAELLKEAIEKILSEFPWPKSMRWGAHEVRWVRPLQSILCIFNGKIVPVRFGPITASNTTRGHRFLAPDEITITDASQYEAQLKKAFVMANRQERKTEILNQLLKNGGGSQYNYNAKLLEEVTGLVEWPTVLVGTIDDAFMDLPEEVLGSEMSNHQKYFAVFHSDGTISNKFLITSNMVNWPDDGKAVIQGNERVLRARLSDGRFFWDMDRKKSLDEWAKGLSHVTYHAKLGTIADKVSRMEKLAAQLVLFVNGADEKRVTRAVHLSKADLTTGMVGEFPELQGVMGRYYALHHGEPSEVADALYKHYKPQGPSDDPPDTPISIVVALADKLDTLISLFAVGEKPTGSKDPFALRRACLGVIRILLENQLRLTLKPLFAMVPVKQIALNAAHEKLAAKASEKLAESNEHLKVGKYLTLNETAHEEITEEEVQAVVEALYAFFIDRLKVMLREEGVRHDVISAVTAGGDDDLLRVVNRARALQGFIESPDGVNLLAGYTRAANILAAEEKKDKIRFTPAQLKPEGLQLAEEKALYTALSASQKVVHGLLTEERYTDAMASLCMLRAPVDMFFDNVLVNDKDTTIRINRLAMLAHLRATMDTIADFSKIEG